ncbi:hypothetical protein ES703_76909 [subsurface metagenome]
MRCYYNRWWRPVDGYAPWAVAVIGTGSVGDCGIDIIGPIWYSGDIPEKGIPDSIEVFFKPFCDQGAVLARRIRIIVECDICIAVGIAVFPGDEDTSSIGQKVLCRPQHGDLRGIIHPVILDKETGSITPGTRLAMLVYRLCSPVIPGGIIECGGNCPLEGICFSLVDQGCETIICIEFKTIGEAVMIRILGWIELEGRGRRVHPGAMARVSQGGG